MPHKRSRTGCLTCRDEGYKCDEAKPHCGRCVRLGKTCQGYGLRVRWKTADSSADAGRIMKKRSPRSKAGAKPQATGSSSWSSSSPEGAPTTPSSASGSSGTGTGTSTNPSRSSCLMRNPSYVSPDISPMNRYLLHHWTGSLAGVISMASGAQNPFLVHLTPMMHRSPALRFSISSMAAGHLAVLRGPGDGDEALRTLSSRHMLAAVSSLRASIETEDPALSLATILMLQISDRLFNTDSRIDHLAGARAVILRSGGPRTWTGDGAQFLLSLCFYHDVMSSISRTSRPLLSMTNVAPLEGLPSLAKLTTLVSVVSAISKMQGQSGEAHQRRGAAIRRDLDSGFGIAADGDPAIEHTIQAYRHAAVIYLYRVWSDDGTTTPPPKPFHAERCIHHLLQVPVASSFVSAHAWPLWTAGCESVDPYLRQLVLERLKALYRTRHLPSLGRVQRDMEEVWVAKDTQRLQFGTENVDCCKVILNNRHREADLV
ncbi:Putative zn(2)Cys(6) fungal-type DNA-binding domain, fungal transcription factor [Colletotrichum destructivum]|uniref:Zn(2)Cys(6) fungal-type DNA-binding domain, fungal transcription factor n=1 Tax=Colletotrichum destructivum TaxID=34406 RepID=A0AAX4I0G3_9PEZI|nr:Putative zn(2)Cys(6) fungal-type DNA-binding domain, fungal transcription factor [Colletotrichum destructivum]